ncbi:hypothetical protein AB6A40_008900 [Gnathostoma spinigerum]|uniref:Uncharacterized protein n=1 Tax=Gnathostoma spinigerum TaxID=75299 RepID=A0ABD6EQS4_9BILA
MEQENPKEANYFKDTDLEQREYDEDTANEGIQKVILKATEGQKCQDDVENNVESDTLVFDGSKDKLNWLASTSGQRPLQIPTGETNPQAQSSDNGETDQQYDADGTSRKEIAYLRCQIEIEKQKYEELRSKSIAQEVTNQRLMNELEVLKGKYDRLEKIKDRIEDDLELSEESVYCERRFKEDVHKARQKLENTLNAERQEAQSIKEEINNLRARYHKLESELKERNAEMHEDADLITKLQCNLRQMVARIEEVEEELTNEKRARQRAERQYAAINQEVSLANENVTELEAQLDVQNHLHNTLQQKVSKLEQELNVELKRREINTSEAYSIQWSTLQTIRQLNNQVECLERETNRVLQLVRSPHEFGMIEELSSTTHSITDENVG